MINIESVVKHFKDNGFDVKHNRDQILIVKNNKVYLASILSDNEILLTFEDQSEKMEDNKT